MASKEVQSTTDLPSGEPVPSGSPAPRPKPFPLKALLAATPSNVDAFLAHVQRCFATPSGIDTTLLFLCYTSRLSSAGLEALTRPAIQRSAAQLLALASTLPPSSTIFFNSKAFPSPSAAALLSLSKRLKTFSLLLSDVRTFLRLWGLLGMYFWGRGLFLRLWAAARSSSGEQINRVETSIAVTQLTTAIIFQSLENAAYLAQKGVLEWQPATIVKTFRWSARFWGAYVGIELGKLFYESYKRGQRTSAERLGDKTVAVVEREERDWTENWRKSVVRQSAWFPLTIHWGLEQGLFSELTVGALGSIPGVVQMRELWSKTAQ